MKNLIVLFILSLIFSCKNTNIPKKKSNKPVVKIENDWALLPFEKMDAVNPCLLPSPTPTFFCPMQNKEVQWELKDVFNPAVVVKDNQVYMVYRAEDTIGKYNGTSRLGLAISNDGYIFKKEPKPILFPDHDFMQKYEWEGGIEDPRIVQSKEGKYIMTYTAYEGKIARLCIASSTDLYNWQKHGLAFSGKYEDLWSKSGAIICKLDKNQWIAEKINGKYWMYFGDKHLHIATSDDLIHWQPIATNNQVKNIISFRANYFDSDLVEPGPPAIITSKGILLIYNGRNYGPDKNTTIEEGTYSGGQALFSLSDPTRLTARLDTAFIFPEKDYEVFGQINKVVFLQGLVYFNQKWLLYYGTADSKIAVAVSSTPLE